MMGMISSGMVVTGSEKLRRPKSVQPGNRKWITVIQTINAEGQAIEPFIIGTGQNHLASWHEESTLPCDWVIVMSQNGWTNNELGLEWLKDFDRRTADRSVGSYRLLILDGHESHHSVQFEANKAFSKRRRAKRMRLQDSGLLTGENTSQLLVEKGVVKEEGRDKGAEGAVSLII
jgi:hypothetical protein